MPNRWIVSVICLFWLIMTGLLVQRDVLPHWSGDEGPDLRAAAAAISLPEPVRWAILQGDVRVGSVKTQWHRRPKNWLEFESDLELKDFPLMSVFRLAGLPSGGLRCNSSFHIAPEGNLDRFNVNVYLADSKPSLRIQGRVNGELMHVTFRSKNFHYDESFYYEPHSMVTSYLTPLDKLPNVRLGQTWQYRVMNPLTRGSETVNCEVVTEQVITWRGEPVPVFVVKQQYGNIQAQCWVRHDGTVLRQEVPVALDTFVLEHE